MALKLPVRRASSSVPSTGMGCRSPVAAMRSVAAVSRSTGRSPARATAAPASAAINTPMPPTTGRVTASLVNTSCVGSRRWAMTNA